jgi:amino acid permease
MHRKSISLIVCLILCSLSYLSTSVLNHQITSSVTHDSKSEKSGVFSQGKQRRNAQERIKISNQRVVGILANSNSVVRHDSHEHKMSLVSLVVNIVADLCPHGMLPLAFGFAQGGPTGLIPAFLLLFIFGSMSAFSMTKFANLATETNSENIAGIWKKLISAKSSWIVDFSIFFLCFGCCIFYSAFIGDIFSALATAFGLNTSRWIVLGAISTLVLLPLCLLEDLSALKFSSLVGVGGILYTLAFHLYRAWDGSYSPGAFLTEFVPSRFQPNWPDVKLPLFSVNKKTLVLANMICVAFLAHYNAINYYKELDEASPRRYAKGVQAGFGISLTVFACMMLAGYFIFGTNSLPLILNNFPQTEDHLASGARFATGLAITFAYPLMFAGLKSSMKSLLFGDKSEVLNSSPRELSQRRWKTSAAIVAVLSLITAIAMKCGEEDVSVVLGIVGSVLGCFVAYVLPGYLSLVNMRLRKKLGLSNGGVDVLVSHALVALGSVFGVLGVWITLMMQAEHVHSD